MVNYNRLPLTNDLKFQAEMYQSNHMMISVLHKSDLLQCGQLCSIHLIINGLCFKAVECDINPS